MKRYPGIRPFTAEDAHLFKGRDKEKRDLFELIVLNDIVVLFGKSGIGKSSLLNAGVCPKLGDRNLHPVFIRLNNTNITPEEQVYEWLQEKKYIPGHLSKGRTLWEYFKEFWYVDLGEKFTPVIIFDQFEELFTLYTAGQRQAFIDQFADIVNGRVPENLRQKIESDPANFDQNIDWENPPSVKFVLSIRSDYLYLLDELSTKIPAILRTRFQLQWLKKSNAIEAITLPAAMAGDFESPPFRYTEDALGEMVNELGKKKADQLLGDLPEAEPEIEAFQLQLLCQHLEDKIIRQKKEVNYQITPDFYGSRDGIKSILKQFYESVISRIPEKYQDAVEALMAKNLIRNKRRIIMEESAIIADTRIPKTLLDQLHEERILRKEARAGHFYYEISHDTLVDPILEKYTLIAERLEKERALAQAKELETARRKAAEETQLRKKAEQNEQRAKQRTRIAGGALLLALLLAGLAFVWYKNAERSIMTAKNAQASASKALLEALEQKTKAEVANNVSIAFSNFDVNSEFALQIADYNQKNHPDNQRAKATFERIINDRKTKFIDSFKHDGLVSSLAFSSDGLGVYSGSHDKSMQPRLLDVEVILQGLREEKTKGNISNEQFTNRKKYFESLSLQELFFDGIELNAEVTSIALSPDNKKIVVGSYDNSLRLQGFDLDPKKRQMSHRDRITSVAFSPDGQHILTGSFDRSAKVWDLNRNRIQSLRHREKVTSVAFSPDGKHILTGSNNTANLWPWDKQKRRSRIIQRFKHTGKINSVAFSPDGRNILTGSEDNTAKLWKLDGSAIQSFSHPGKVTSLAFSPDGAFILTGCLDGKARLWDRNGKVIQQFSHTDQQVTSVAYAPDGRKIMVGGSKGTVELFKTIDNLLAHRRNGFSLQELYDSGVILTAEDLKKVKQKETELVLKIDTLNTDLNRE